ncbi:MAG TPA: ATPase domain-containing protein, partial [Lysobacter sp.]
MIGKSAKSGARRATAYVCSDCGSEHSKWQGQCVDCGQWNTLSEIALEAAAAPVKSGVAQSRRSGWAGKVDPPAITALKDVTVSEESRETTHIGEFDRVLGGGLVHGSVVLVGGDPGIGKSTLLLQAVAQMAQTMPGLYVTGEESLAQVAGRAVRLGLPLEGVHALAETCIERILE